MKRLETLQWELPDCVFELQYENLKKSLALAHDVCTFDPDYVITLNVLVDPNVPMASSSSLSSSSSSDASSAVNALTGSSTLVASVAIVAVAFGYL